MKCRMATCAGELVTEAKTWNPAAMKTNRARLDVRTAILFTRKFSQTNVKNLGMIAAHDRCGEETSLADGCLQFCRPDCPSGCLVSIISLPRRQRHLAG